MIINYKEFFACHFNKPDIQGLFFWMISINIYSFLHCMLRCQVFYYCFVAAAMTTMPQAKMPYY